MLYLKRKSDGKEFPVWKYIKSDLDNQVYVWVYTLGKIWIPSDNYELIFKP